MARTAYWVIDLASYSEPTNAEIAAGQRSGGTAAFKSGSESFTATTGSGTVTEATTVTGLAPGTRYRLSWTIFDDVFNSYATATHKSLLVGAAILSNPEAVNITDTAATPKVTVSY